LIRLRRQLPHFHHTGPLRHNDHKIDNWYIDWIYPTGYPHHDNVNAIGYILMPPKRDSFWQKERHYPLVILLNGSHRGTNFRLPEGEWKVLVDGYKLEVNAFGLSTVPNARGDYHTHPGSGAILAPA
jgi:hypothetical protein